MASSRAALILLTAMICVLLPAPALADTARPTYPPGAAATTDCSDHVCVHRATSGALAPSDPQAFVEAASAAATTEIEILGFQAPKSDAGSPGAGPTGAMDIYVYPVDGGGYVCGSDDPDLADVDRTASDASLFCIIDPEIGSDLQASVAAAIFEGIASGYDHNEDAWFRKASATWMASVVFAGSTAHLGSLVQSAIPYPDFPLDYTDGNFPLRHEAAWLFLEYVAAYAGQELGIGRDPSIVREAWERAANREHHEDINEYSIQALGGALTARALELQVLFGSFNWHNWSLVEHYEDGQAYVDALVGATIAPTPYVTKTHYFSRRTYSTGWWQQRLYHLSAVNIGFKPKRGIPSGTQLRVEVDAPTRRTSPQARYSVLYADGSSESGYIRLNKKGKGNVTSAFSGGVVDRVILTMINASARYVGCGSGTPLSCGGYARDELLPYRWRATIL